MGKPYVETGKKIKELRKRDGRIQETLAESLGLHVNTFAYAEQGRVLTHPLLLRICEALNVSGGERKELLETYDREAWANLASKHTPQSDEIYIVLNDKDYIGRPLCLNDFSPQGQEPSSLSQDSDRKWLRRIFAFKPSKSVKIVMASRPRRGDNSPLLSKDENEGLRIIEEKLKPLRIKTCYAEADENPDPSHLPLIMIGGPGKNVSSAQVNEKFISEPWIQSFFFENKDPHDEYDWAIRHRVYEQICINMADVAIMERRTDNEDPPFRDLEDGEAQDFGIFFVGLHPLAPQHWTIMAAGLRSVGTFAAAAALREPSIIRLIGEHLHSRRNFAVGMVRYRFRNTIGIDRYRGCLSSVFLTRGIMAGS